MTKQFAVMDIKEGEEIISGLVGGIIAGTGRYKFLAKKNLAGKFEWAHFVERESGAKENVYRGVVENMEQLKLVMEIMNRNLISIFGKEAEMKEGMPKYRSLLGSEYDDTVN